MLRVATKSLLPAGIFGWVLCTVWWKFLRRRNGWRTNQCCNFCCSGRDGRAPRGGKPHLALEPSPCGIYCLNFPKEFWCFLPSSPHDEFWAIPQGAGRIGWNFAEIDACAKAMMGSLPMSIHTLVNSEDWKGGDIVRLDSALVRPGANDVAINYFFLKPVLEHSPHKVT